MNVHSISGLHIAPFRSSTYTKRELTRVLVVDDDHAIADSLSVILQVKGYAVRVAYSAEEGIAITECFKPDALVADIVMPGGMSGIEMAAHFAKHHPLCKVLLVSGDINVIALVRHLARRVRYHAILSKPYHPAEILRAVAGCERPYQMN